MDNKKLIYITFGSCINKKLIYITSTSFINNNCTIRHMQTNNESQVCRYFITGYCRYGNYCKFDHPIGQPNIKICKFFLRGCCTFGNSCMHTHAVKLSDLEKNIGKCSIQFPVAAKILEYENEGASTQWSTKKLKTSHTYNVSFFTARNIPWWNCYISNSECKKNENPGIGVLFPSIHLYGGLYPNSSISIPLYTKNGINFHTMSDCADESFNLSSFIKNISNLILDYDFSEVMRAFFGLYSKNKTFIHLLFISKEICGLQDIGKIIQKFVIFLSQPLMSNTSLVTSDRKRFLFPI